jgi:uncharacterized protein
MKRVFADTFYWIALTDVRDSAHQQAAALSNEIKEWKLVTSDEMLIEYLTFFARFPGGLRRAAGDFADWIAQHSAFEVIAQSRETFEAGLRLYRARSDKAYSMTDCISMEMMRLEAVLTNDHHFEQEGFRVLFPQAR